MDEGSLMDSNRKFAKHWLQKATKTEYDLVVSEANLTDEQLDILTKTMNEDSQVKQSLDSYCSVSRIKRKIKAVYDKVYVVLCRLFYAT